MLFVYTNQIVLSIWVITFLFLILSIYLMSNRIIPLVAHAWITKGIALKIILELTFNNNLIFLSLEFCIFLSLENWEKKG